MLATAVLLLWLYQRVGPVLSSISLGGLDPLGWPLALVATAESVAILHPRSAAAVRAVA